MSHKIRKSDLIKSVLGLNVQLYLKAELSGDVHPPQLHVHGDDFHGADSAPLHRTQELVEIPGL